MDGEKLSVEHLCEFGASVLCVRTEILVEFFERGELRVRGGALMVGAESHDADCVAIFRCLLEQW